MKKKIYIGCALTHAPEEFRIAISELKDKLRQDYEILDFIGLEKGTAEDVFEWDTKCVRSCDLLVADCTHPAIGLGIEIGVAIENNKPMLLVAHKDAKIGRMILGITHPKFSFHRYNDSLEVVTFIKERIRTL